MTFTTVRVSTLRFAEVKFTSPQVSLDPITFFGCKLEDKLRDYQETYIQIDRFMMLEAFLTVACWGRYRKSQEIPKFIEVFQTGLQQLER